MDAEDPSIAGALGGRITVGALGGHTSKGALAGGDGAVLSSKSIRCSGVLAFWSARSAVAAASAALRACVAAEAEAAAAAFEPTADASVVWSSLTAVCRIEAACRGPTLASIRKTQRFVS